MLCLIVLGASQSSLSSKPSLSNLAKRSWSSLRKRWAGRTMTTAPNPSIELLRHLTPAELAGLDDEAVRRIASYLRNTEYDRLDALCAQEVASFEAGPLLFLTQFTATENPQHEQQGLPFLGPFPRRSYFVPLFQEFLNKHKCLFVPKSRTMMTSLSAMGFATWCAAWKKEETVVQTANEDKCGHL